MNTNYYKPIPCGETLPLKNPHAFSVSMPKISDVIDYEEQRKCSKEKIKTAYPRIVTHPYINMICEYAGAELGLTSKNLFLVPNLESAEYAANISGTTPLFHRFHKYILVEFSQDQCIEASKYFAIMKHCGLMIFSREAADFLSSVGINIEPFDELINSDQPDKVIKDVLAEGYCSEDIVICNCGMNAIYNSFKLIKETSLDINRELFILFGWAYSDTIEIIKKCSNEFIIIPDVNDIESLNRVLEKRGHEVAALYLETVSNPLIAVPDIPLIHKLSEQFGFYIMIDNTFATPWCVDISPFCDVIIESLTKFASGEGDVMAGAVILPKDSRLNKYSMKMIELNCLPLYIRDRERLAHNITGYKERMIKVSENSLIVEKALHEIDYIKKIYSVNSVQNVRNWRKISKDMSCGVVSILLNEHCLNLYDEIVLPKGPSLGTEFPILMAYTLLAHYELTKSCDGRKYLSNAGVEPDLLRLSIGSDSPHYIVSALSALSKKYQ